MDDDNDNEWRVRATEVAGRWQAIRDAIPWAGRVLVALAITVPIKFSIALVELIAGRQTEVVVDFSLAGAVSTGSSLLLATLMVTIVQLRKQNKLLHGQNEELRARLDELEGPQEDQ